MNKFYFLALDLDGTLLNSKKLVSESNVKSLKKAREAGISIIIISGRHYKEIISFLDQSKLTNDIKYIISCDGQYIYSQDKCIKTFPFLTKKDILNIYKLIHIKEFDVYTDKLDFFVGRSIRNFFYTNLRRIYKKRGPIYCFPHLLRNLQFEKINICRNISAYVLSSLEESYTIHKKTNNDREIVGVEILPKSVNKFLALNWLFEHNEIALDNLLYFGDDYNDEECFKQLPHSVVMGNAPLSLKGYSVIEAGTNDEDGVANSIQKLILNN